MEPYSFYNEKLPPKVFGLTAACLASKVDVGLKRIPIVIPKHFIRCKWESHFWAFFSSTLLHQTSKAYKRMDLNTGVYSQVITFGYSVQDDVQSKNITIFVLSAFTNRNISGHPLLSQFRVFWFKLRILNYAHRVLSPGWLDMQSLICFVHICKMINLKYSMKTKKPKLQYW
jgi:hypothetical protein